MTALAPAVESFFTDYLTAQRGASPHTIASYRGTLRLLFTWIREQSGTRPSDLDFTDVDAATVSGFLAMLEKERHKVWEDLKENELKTEYQKKIQNLNDKESQWKEERLAALKKEMESENAELEKKIEK